MCRHPAQIIMDSLRDEEEIAQLERVIESLRSGIDKQLKLGCQCSSSTGEMQTKGPDSLCFLHLAIKEADLILSGDKK